MTSSNPSAESSLYRVSTLAREASDSITETVLCFIPTLAAAACCVMLWRIRQLRRMLASCWGVRATLSKTVSPEGDNLSLSPIEYNFNVSPIGDRTQRYYRRRFRPAAARSRGRAQLREAREIQEDFIARVEPLLTQEQMKEWEAIRKEARKAAVEKWRSR